MQKKDEIWSKFLISVCAFFTVGLVLLALWNIFLAREITKSGKEIEGFKEDIERIKILGKFNKKFQKDVLRQKSISLCFWDLISSHNTKYLTKEIQDCIQLIVITDEQYGHKGLDAPLILAWLEMESDGDPEAVSYAGAKGLTQLMDFRAEEMITSLGYPDQSAELVFNPVVNLEGGLRHFIYLMNYWSRSGIKNQFLILFYALHSYKWGTERTEELFNTEWRAFRPAIKYVDWVLNRREFWEEELKYWMNNIQKSEKKRGNKQKKLFFRLSGLEDNLDIIKMIKSSGVRSITQEILNTKQPQKAKTQKITIPGRKE